MKDKIFLVNSCFLFLCTSMYLGTGWSLVLFSFPNSPDLTPDNYYLQFVPQVTRATEFFTCMTIMMMISACIMIYEEWKNKFKWYPVGVLLLTFLTTYLTTQYIFEYNERMGEGIKELTELQEVLNQWMKLNIVRVWIWTIQWLLMMTYFAKTHRQAEQ